MPTPYCDIKCEEKVKILGHIMTTKIDLNDTTDDSVTKANIAWALLGDKALRTMTLTSNLG